MTTLVGPSRRLTYKDCAQRWGVTVWTVRVWLRGMRRFSPTKRTVQFDEEDIEKFELHRTVETRSRRLKKN